MNFVTLLNINFLYIKRTLTFTLPRSYYGVKGQLHMKFIIETLDKRNVILKDLLKAGGLDVQDYNLHEKDKKNAAGQNTCFIFSPAKKISAEEAVKFPAGIKVFAGNINPEVQKVFEAKNITHINFMTDDVFAYKNALLTAEGTLAEIMLSGEKSLFGNKYLLLGYGRCTKTLALILSKLGIKYDIASFTEKHGESCIFAEKTYFKYEFLEDLKNYDMIINSIPHKIFEDDMLLRFKPGACLLEIASVNCINADAVKNFKYVLCPALPQKYTCKSAAALMYQKITHSCDI